MINSAKPIAFVVLGEMMGFASLYPSYGPANDL